MTVVLINVLSLFVPEVFVLCVWDLKVVVLSPIVCIGSWLSGLLVFDWVLASRRGVVNFDMVGGLNLNSMPVLLIIFLSAMGVCRIWFISSSVVCWRASSVCFVACG